MASPLSPFAYLQINRNGRPVFVFKAFFIENKTGKSKVVMLHLISGEPVSILTYKFENSQRIFRIQFVSGFRIVFCPVFEWSFTILFPVQFSNGPLAYTISFIKRAIIFFSCIKWSCLVDHSKTGHRHKSPVFEWLKQDGCHNHSKTRQDSFNSKLNHFMQNKKVF
jgi:hypothetical protein